MRVPSIGVTLEERRFIREIVREGYAVAERMLANYQDPAPGALARLGGVWRQGWSSLRGAMGASVRN